MLWMRRTVARLIAPFAADRVVRHRVVETTVMGQGASLVTATCMIFVAVFQLVTRDASHVVETFGGTLGSVLWSIALLLSSLLVWGGRIFHCKPAVSLALEIPGTFLLGLAIAAYAFTIWGQGGFLGQVFLITLCGAKAVNLLLRAWMLHRRRDSAWIVHEKYKGLL